MLLSFAKTAWLTREAEEGEFERLMRDTYRQAYAFAFRLSGSQADAEDLVQEAYVRAYRFFDRYDRSQAFTSWLFRILTNVHIDSIRRRGKAKHTSLDQKGLDGQTTWDLPDESAAPDRDMLQNAMDDAIQLGLRSMTPEFRSAVLLADVEGMSYEEIAEVMGTSVGTVRSRIHRGRKQLRDHLERSCPEKVELWAN